MEFYFPTEFGERLAFLAAAVTVVFGVLLLFAPASAQRLFGLQLRDARRDGLADTRSTGGFYVGFGLSALLVAQDWIYLALGASFAMAAFARVVSLLSDKGYTVSNYTLLLVQAVLAALLLGYVSGWFAA